MTRTPLETVELAADYRRTADRQYVTALERAYRAGSSLQAIASAAGCSREAVRRMLLRNTTPRQEA